MFVLQTILGHGIDCHLLGLKETAAMLDMPTPKLFTDDTYKQSNHFTLSTSQVSKGNNCMQYMYLIFEYQQRRLIRLNYVLYIFMICEIMSHKLLFVY